MAPGITFTTKAGERPITLSPGQAEAVVSAVLHWSRESGDVPEDVALLGQALVAQLKD